MSFADDLRKPFNNMIPEEKIDTIVRLFESEICNKAIVAKSKKQSCVKGFLSYFNYDGEIYYIQELIDKSDLPFSKKILVHPTLPQNYPLEQIKRKLEVVLKELGFNNFTLDIVTVRIYKQVDAYFLSNQKYVFDKFQKTIYIEYHW